MLSLGEILGLSCLWRIHVDAMAASITFDVDRLHGALGGGRMLDFGHCAILPRVFTTVEEDDVVAFNVKATVV